MRSPHLPATVGQSKRTSAGRLLTWPGAPHANAVVDTLTDMLCRTGASVYEAKPIEWRRWLERADLVAIHWPDEIFWSYPPVWRLAIRIARVWIKLAILRLRGARIVWFVHNLRPHDLPQRYVRAWMIYTSGLARLANGWLTLSPSTGDEVTRALPALARRPSAFVWHPPYDWKSPVSRAAARATLSYGADEVILAHVGLLRSYKGLTEFIEVFAAGDLPDTRLLLAGEVPSPEYGAELTKLAAATDRVAFQCGRLDVHAYNLRLQAADIFVAPYWHFLHSGALVHALCRGCVVVAPDAPFTRDLVAAVGGQWLVLFAEKVTTDSIAEARARAIDNRNGKPDLTRLRPEANLSWLTSFVSSL